MLLINQNSTQQINAALLDAENNIEKRTKTTLISSVISAVYGAVKVMFEELKNTLAKVAHTGDYNDLINKPVVVDVVQDGNMNAVTSNAVNDTLANYGTKTDLTDLKNKLVNSQQYTMPNNNANEAIIAGIYSSDLNTQNLPYNAYGVLEVYGQKTDIPSASTQWIFQRFISTERRMFSRCSINGNSLKPDNWSNWREIVVKSEVGKYYDYIPNALDIGDFRNGYCSSVSINIPYNFAWGSREIKVISGNQAIAILTGVTNDGVNHHWINIYNFGNWSGWQDTIN